MEKAKYTGCGKQMNYNTFPCWGVWLILIYSNAIWTRGANGVVSDLESVSKRALHSQTLLLYSMNTRKSTRLKDIWMYLSFVLNCALCKYEIHVGKCLMLANPSLSATARFRTLQNLLWVLLKTSWEVER